jgi:chromate transporter
MADDRAAAPPPTPPIDSPSARPDHFVPTRLQIFCAFARIALSGFGGVLAWARRVLVQDMQWLSPQEFAEVLALCQVLPGPNIVNMSAVLGFRWAGLTGACAAFLGLVGAPALLMVGAGFLYQRYGDVPELRGILTGLAAAAAGLIAAAAAQIAEPMVKRRPGLGHLVAVLTLVASGVLRLPIIWVIVMMVPLAIVCAWWERAPS